MCLYRFSGLNSPGLRRRSRFRFLSESALLSYVELYQFLQQNQSQLAECKVNYLMRSCDMGIAK